MSEGEIRAEARRWATLLRDVPRDEIAPRFPESAEKIRQEAIVKGTAIGGDREAD